MVIHSSSEERAGQGMWGNSEAVCLTEMIELGESLLSCEGGSSFGDVLDLLALQVAVEDGCDSHGGEGSHLSP